MEKILGIDTGTNSLGWAIVEKDGDEYRLLDKGTNIFSEGVKVEKGKESSKASERTGYRSLRKHYWRRKVRKIRLLTILVEHELCPYISPEALRQWRLKKQYPMDDEFMAWQRTEDKEDKNPYHYRYICLTEKLDLTKISNRYILGRALYHLNQRRGFLSNRKESTEAVDGKVKQGISSLSEDMEKQGCAYLGEYFYLLYQRGEKIRKHYTARKEHYLKEFRAICEKQELEASLVAKLEKAIFFQRPLKSQKGTVGTCTFEKGKPRCPSSHPLYEDFRMYQFINSIKIQTPEDGELRQLTDDEKNKIIPKFKRKPKSKRTFPFEDIAKELAGKKNYCYFKDKEQKPYKFNYQMDASVSYSIVNAQLEDIFGTDWKEAVCEVYTLANGKTSFEIVNDVWHALYFYDDAEKLKGFAKNRLQLSDEEAEKFSKINLPNDYAALSLKAIRKILPFMRDYGLIYSKAVFLANLGEIIPYQTWGIKELRGYAIDGVIEVMNSYDNRTEPGNLASVVRDYLQKKYHVTDDILNKLYHPSMLEHYPRQRSDENGIFQLGSPRINSVRNPMAMHSLFRLRKVVNLLLKEGKIDENTTIHIEFSRELNDANKRKAIRDTQRNNEKNRNEYRKKIEEMGFAPVSDTDILKYELWEEQGHHCLYTGEQISVTDFLGANPKYDIEHTIPRSVGGDSTKENMTLCSSKFNREVKRAKLPTELSNYDEIIERIEAWKEKYESLEKQMRAERKKGKVATTKEQKDKSLQKCHFLKMQHDYWKGKYNRFTMEVVPEGFARRQGAGIGLISRYARLYLKSVFDKVYVVKGTATSNFRMMWGIQKEYTKKERVNHVHHCIDAITIACIGLNEYNKLAEYYHKLDEYKYFGKEKPQFEKPWPTFAEDVKKIEEELLVAHYSQDNLPKHTRKRIGRTYAQGDTARVSLHNETYYGAIEKDEEVKYVVRKPLDGMEEKDIENIVDDVVRQKVKDAVVKHGSLKKAVESTIWMNEQLQIPIKKVRILTRIKRPTHIRQQRDQSRKEYKRQFHVENDRNYMMAIYIGKNEKGKEKRDFVLINNLEAAKYYKRSDLSKGSLVPKVSANGYPLAYKLKIGTMVLLYENSPEEIWQSDKRVWKKRLYKVIGISSTVIGNCVYGRISLIHHQEAHRSSDVKLKNGAFVSGEDARSGIMMLHTQIKALIQDIDFEINDIGEIKRLR